MVNQSPREYISSKLDLETCFCCYCCLCKKKKKVYKYIFLLQDHDLLPCRMFCLGMSRKFYLIYFFNINCIFYLSVKEGRGVNADLQPRPPPHICTFSVPFSPRSFGEYNCEAKSFILCSLFADCLTMVTHPQAYFTVLGRLGIHSTNNELYVVFNVQTFAFSHPLTYFYFYFVVLMNRIALNFGAGEFLQFGFNSTVDVMHWTHLSLKSRSSRLTSPRA